MSLLTNLERPGTTPTGYTPLSVNTSPDISQWYNMEQIGDIPDDQLGWFLSNGWTVTDVSRDDTTVPATTLYDLARWRFSSQDALIALIQSYLIAYNEGRSNNDTRYDDIVSIYNDTIVQTSNTLDRAAAAHNATHTYYLASLNTMLSAVNTGVASSLAIATDTYNQAQAGLATFAGKLLALGSGYDAYAAQVTTILASQTTSLNTYLAAIDTLRGLFETDYTTHAATTRALLTGLGTTELARINEAFTASLNTELQRLTSSGFYVSTVSTDVTARNTREKNEQIALLNDKLNREKLDNEHKLYSQLTAVREEALKIRGLYRQAQDEANKWALQQYERKVVLLNEFTRAYLSGQSEYVNATNRTGSELVQARDRGIHLALQARTEYNKGLETDHTQTQRLIGWQLDTRNNLIAGLFRTMEGREDGYPGIESIGQLVGSLGDANVVTPEA